MNQLQKLTIYYLALNGLKNYLDYPDSYSKEQKLTTLEKIAEEAFNNSDNIDNIDKKIFNHYYGLSERIYSINELSKELKITKESVSHRKTRMDKIIISHYLLKMLKLKPENIRKEYAKFEKHKLYKEEVTRLRNIGYTWKEVCEELKINFRTAKKAFDKFLR